MKNVLLYDIAEWLMKLGIIVGMVAIVGFIFSPFIALVIILVKLAIRL